MGGEEGLMGEGGISAEFAKKFGDVSNKQEKLINRGKMAILSFFVQILERYL